MGCHTFQYHRHTILMHPLQELLTSCQSQQNGLILSLASLRKRPRTRNGSGIVPSAVRASARVKVGGRFAKMLARIVVRPRSARGGTVSDRIRRVPTRGRKRASVPFAHRLIPDFSPPDYVDPHSVLFLFLFFFVYPMYVCIFSLSMALRGRLSVSFLFCFEECNL